MWQPTHIEVTVQRAKNLLIKGKNGRNNAFVIIELGKDKFQTSIHEHATENVSWHEECELIIPQQGNTATLRLTAYHRNSFGLDDFLGQVTLPLNEFDVYERPRSRSYPLKGKPEKEKKKGEKYRGELEVKVAFTVKSGSHLDTPEKKHQRASLSSLKHFGGSLLSIGSRDDKHSKKFTHSISSKLDKMGIRHKKKKSRDKDSTQDVSDDISFGTNQSVEDADPGVISDEEFGFDEEVKVSGPVYTPAGDTSLLASTNESMLNLVDEEPNQEEMEFPNKISIQVESLTQDVPDLPSIPTRAVIDEPNPEFIPALTKPVIEDVPNYSSPKKFTATEALFSDGSPEPDSRHQLKKETKFKSVPSLNKLYDVKHTKKGSSADSEEKKSKSERWGFKGRLFHKQGDEKALEEVSRIVEGGNDRFPMPPGQCLRLPQEVHDKFMGKSREDLMEMILKLQSSMDQNVARTRELETYIDHLLLKVMETSPQLLQAPVMKRKERL